MSHEVNVAQVIASAPDLRDEYREMLMAKREELRGQGVKGWFKAAKIAKTLRNDRLFERSYNFAIHEAASSYVTSSEFGDGEFAKYFLEWWVNGGWESIIAFLEKLIPLLGGLAVLMLLASLLNMFG